MSELILTPLRIVAGIWQGELSGVDADAPPALVLTHGAEQIAAPDVKPLENGTWLVEVAVPARYLADGVQTFIISTRDGGETLASFAFIGGAAVSDDIRAELDLLRGELDMLKRAFRRYCVETQAD